jgi:hypothetical protein
MWVWLAVVLLFFSIPQSKPVGYAMPVLFPLAALCADAMLATWARTTRRDAVLRLGVASAVAAGSICVATVGYFSLASHRNNLALAQTLARLRAPGDPVLFVDQYFFDVPLQARLSEPVPVLSDWHSSSIAAHDNWKRELDEARLFAPRLAQTLLVDDEQAMALRCGTAPLWALARDDAQPRLQAIAGARLVEHVNATALWRIPPDACGSLVDQNTTPTGK